LGTVEKSDFGKKFLVTINPFIPVIRCTFWARFEKSDFSKKSDFLSQSIRLSPSSVVLFGHGLRNPIFPKNRISYHNQSVYPRHPLYFLGTVEKSDFSQKFLVTINPFIPVIRCTSWARFEKSYFSQKFLITINPFIPVIRCTSWARLRNPIFPKNHISCHNQSVYPRHPLYFLGTV
jgi:hypothetical protein